MGGLARGRVPTPRKARKDAGRPRAGCVGTSECHGGDPGRWEATAGASRSVSTESEVGLPLTKLALARLGFVLRARLGGRLPVYKGSLLRSVLGAALKRISCPFPGRQCDECTLAARCVFWQVFRTPMPDGLGFGGDFAPHPFVISPGDFGKVTYEAGERMAFRLTLVGRGIELLPYFVAAFQVAGERGLGSERTPFEVEVVGALEGTGKWVQVWPEQEGDGVPELTWRDVPWPEGESAVLHFVTPVRLQEKGRLVTRLDFPLLTETLARRVQALGRAHCVGGEGDSRESERRTVAGRAGAVGGAGSSAVAVGHGGEGSEDDWIGEMRELAGKVGARPLRGTSVSRKHYSSRQRHEFELRGALGALRLGEGWQSLAPLLAVGQLIHVGKSTSYGYGWYRLEAGAP